MKKILSLLLTLLLVVSVVPTALAEFSLPDWDREADVVIVGFGAAGANAARTAVKEGVSVLVVEKASKDYAGGSARLSNGNLNSVFTAEGLFDSSKGRISQETANEIADHGLEACQWLYDNGLEMEGEYAVGSGVAFYNTLAKDVLDLGVEVLYETPATNLVQDPYTKEIWGVECTGPDGATLHIKANKGVILCTGNYCSNPDLITRFHFADMPPYTNMGSPFDTGDGLLMALKAGASLDGISNQQLEWWDVAFTKASEELGTGVAHFLDPFASDARIYVNANGKRFMNEDEMLMHSKEQFRMFDYDGIFPVMGTFKNFPMYLIFDSTVMEAGPVGPRDLPIGYLYAHDIYRWSDDNRAEVEKGWITEADTLEELAEKMGINAENLVETVKTWNESCDAGQDTAFNRPSYGLCKVEVGPFYAAELEPAIIYTIGGLVCGENMETLDWESNPIPRLYHAGDVGQPTKFLIMCLQGAMGTGAIAAEACAKLDSH